MQVFFPVVDEPLQSHHLERNRLTTDAGHFSGGWRVHHLERNGLTTDAGHFSAG